MSDTEKMTISEAAVDAAYAEIPDDAGRYIDQSDIRIMLEAAAPHMLDECEVKLAAIIVALDPLERVTNWAAADDGMDCPAFRAIRKIRTILDAAR